MNKTKVSLIQKQVFSWYTHNRRDLPWRKTIDPYAILVSEIMLQQTQVSRVVPKYRAFLQQFPTLESLASSTPAQVLRAWKGLGYNRRALNLQKTAKILVQTNKSKFPTSVSELRQLPGIGSYTAGAVATFAFNQIAPAVDTNVRQFIDYLVPSRRKRTESEYEAAALALVPPRQPKEWLHAVMDYTSLVIRVDSARLKRSKKSSAEPFIGSNRYLRGQVIDRLRERAYNYEELFERVAKPVESSRELFISVLDGLKRDGMIDQRCDEYRLTGDN